MSSHNTDWFPGRVSDTYRENYDLMDWRWDELQGITPKEDMSTGITPKECMSKGGREHVER